MSFAEQFSIFMVKVSDASRERCQDVARRVSESIVNMTPVGIPEQVDDPGHAKANWQATIGQPANSELVEADPDGNATLAKIEDVIQRWRPETGESFWLTNCVPYIPVLEYGLYPTKGRETARTINGYSKQAPSGMVGITVAKFGGDFRGFMEKMI